MQGIYCIKNKITGDIYVGSAVSMKKRKYRHFSSLRKNIHHSAYLQRAFNRYGETSFLFFPLKFVADASMLIQSEQYFIDRLNPSYNMCKIAGSTLGTKQSVESNKRRSDTIRTKFMTGEIKPVNHRLGKKWSEEVKKKIADGNKGKIVSLETKEKISQKRIARNDKTVNKMAQEKNAKGFTVYKTNGVYIGKFFSIREASEITGITRSTLSRAVNGDGNIYSRHKKKSAIEYTVIGVS